ncbi:efflux RND transporter permease subunit [bacterium]|nr:efflux RND transporter permease subunit [bacterium]
MKLANFSVKRPVTTIMIFLGVILLGIISWDRLPQELFPPMVYPQLTVVARYANAAPEEIENLITKVVEEAIGTVRNLKSVKSISKEGVSLVTAEFTWGTDMDFAALGLREKIDLIKDRLPRDSEEPIVMKFNPFALPTMIFSITGPQSPVELLRITRRVIKDRIEKVEGVASATTSGGQEREILVEVDQGRLYASNISILTVVDALKSANVNYPAGTTKQDFYEYLIRTMGEFESISEIEDTVVAVDEGREPGTPYSDKRTSRLIFLKEIGDVKDAVKEKTSLSRYNGQENISLSIQKQAAANTIKTAKRIREELKLIKASLPKSVKVDIIYDQSIFIKNSIDGVKNAAIQGGILAFFVLLFFLRNVRNSVIVATTIPISMMAVISMMYFKGLTLNMMSLGGLALGVGMLVDNAIVVVENVARHRRAKKDIKEAAIDGTNEVSGAIASSTLTSVAVFLPMVFAAGIAGQIFKELCFTVTFALFASLGVAMTLIPRLASTPIRQFKWFSKRKGAIHCARNDGFNKLNPYNSGQGSPVVPTTGSNQVPPPSRLSSFFSRLSSLQGLTRFYTKLLRIFLIRKTLSLGIVFLIFVGSIFLLMGIDKEFMPKIDEGEFIIKVNMPMGTKLEITDSVVGKIEELLWKIPEIKNATVNAGSSSKTGIETLGSHQGRIIVNLHKKWPKRGMFRNEIRPFAEKLRIPGKKPRPTQEVIQALKIQVERKNLGGAGVEYVLQDSVFKSMVQASAPIVVEVKGQNLGVLKNLSENIRNRIKRIRGIYGVKTSLTQPAPETKVEVNKDRASAFSLSVTDIARTALIAIKGVVATKFKEEGKEINIKVRLREEDRNDITKLRGLLVHSPMNVEVPLNEVAKITSGKGPSEIRRINQQRAILISANIFKRGLTEVTKEVTQVLSKCHRLTGYSIILAGESKEIRESFKSLQFILMLSILLVYMIMAAQFESLWQPFIIMLTLPLSVIGIALILFITGTPLSAVALLGVIMLGGIVVNNGIVLIDYINNLRKKGVEIREAIIRAGRIRLRPILMTTLTTVLGLLPMALGLGEGAELRAPLAITVMGGLLVSTCLTLLVIPTFYLISAKLMKK